MEERPVAAERGEETVQVRAAEEEEIDGNCKLFRSTVRRDFPCSGCARHVKDAAIMKCRQCGIVRCW